MYKQLLFLFFITFLSYGQQNQWSIDSTASLVQYKGDHVLHSWEGLNEKVYGVAIPNETKNGIDQLAILVYVRDFDSNNSGRDAHALEILDALKYPEIRFYSNEIEILEEQMILNGSFDFHGNKIEKKITAALKQKDSEWKIQGTFQLNPTDFKIDLPAFLSIKMKDLLEINYSIVLKK